jgi:hypothetical protein
MPELQVSVVLPYYLRLAEGDYQTCQAGEVVQVVAPLLLEGTVPCTSVCALFTPEESADLDEIHKRRVRCGEQLLRRINRLLRWYRSVSRQADWTRKGRSIKAGSGRPCCSAGVPSTACSTGGMAPWSMPPYWTSGARPATSSRAWISSCVTR